LDHDVVIAALMAALSLVTPLAKDATGLCMLVPAMGQDLREPSRLPRQRRAQ
jgi:hypothetical protein